MKPQILFIICLLFSIPAITQEFFDDFEDGSVEGWTHIDGSITGITNEDEGGNKYLQKIADGTTSPLGYMSIANETDTWTGDNYGGGFGIFGGLVFDMKNDNNFDLKIRLGFRGGSDDTIIVTADPLVIPANSGWANYGMEPYTGTILNGKATVTEIMENTLEMRILHSEEVSWEGDVISGTIAIDNLSGVLLSKDDFLKDTIRLSPNPFSDRMEIRIPSPSGSIEIYDVLGRKVHEAHLNKTAILNLQNLKSGIYLARIATETGAVTKKIVKK